MHNLPQIHEINHVYSFSGDFGFYRIRNFHIKMGSQESSPHASPQDKIQQWKIQFPDYVKDAEYSIRLQELLFNLTPQSLNDASAILRRDYIKDRKSADIFINNIFLAATYRPHNCELLAELYKSLCLFGENEIEANSNSPSISVIVKTSFLQNVFSPLPESNYFPIFRWGHLRFVHYCIKNGSLLAIDICKNIRNLLNSYPEFLNLILFLFAFFAKEIDENDHQLFSNLYDYYQNNLSYSTNRSRIRKIIHPLLIEFFNKLPEYQKNDYQLLHHEIEIGYHPNSIAYSLLVKKEIPENILQKIENLGKSIPDANKENDENDNAPRINLDMNISDNIENMKRLDPIVGNTNNKENENPLETIIEPSIFAQCPIMQNTQPTLLQFCAYHGITQCFNQLLSLFDAKYFHNDDIKDKIPPQKVTDFAVAGGSSSIIEILNNKSKDPSFQYQNNQLTEGFVNYHGCLAVAALHHRYDMYQWLQNEFNNEVQSSLYQSVRSNNIKVLLSCFDAGIDITLPEEEDPYYISFEDKMNKSKIVKRYQLNTIMTKNQLTPLHYACIYGSIEAANLLTEQPDKDLFKSTTDGMTPFLYAAQFGYKTIIKMILERAGSVVFNEQNKIKMNALHYASMKGYSDIVTILLEENSRIPLSTKTSSSSSFGKVKNSYSNFVDDEDYKKVSKKNKKKFDINQFTVNFSTPLHLACQYGHSEVVKVLFDQFEDFSLSCTGKSNALNINARDKLSCTPLHLAVMNGYTNVVELLLSFPKIDVNAVNTESQTPLIIATKNESADIVSLLLNTPNIHKDIQDRSANTAQKYAEKSGNEVLMRLFSQSNNGGVINESVGLL